MKVTFDQLVVLAEAASTPRPNVAPYNAGRRDYVNNDAYNRQTANAQRYKDAGWMKKMGMRLGLDREARNAYKAQKRVSKADINSLNAQADMSDKEIEQDRHDHDYNMGRRKADRWYRSRTDDYNDSRFAPELRKREELDAYGDERHSKDLANRRSSDDYADVRHGEDLKHRQADDTSSDYMRTQRRTTNQKDFDASNTARSADATYRQARVQKDINNRAMQDQLNDTKHELETGTQTSDALKQNGWQITSGGLHYTMNANSSAPEWVFDAKTRQPRQPSTQEVAAIMGERQKATQQQTAPAATPQPRSGNGRFTKRNP